MHEKTVIYVNFDAIEQKLDLRKILTMKMFSRQWHTWKLPVISTFTGTVSTKLYISVNLLRHFLSLNWELNALHNKKLSGVKIRQLKGDIPELSSRKEALPPGSNPLIWFREQTDCWIYKTGLLIWSFSLAEAVKRPSCWIISLSVRCKAHVQTHAAFVLFVFASAIFWKIFHKIDIILIPRISRQFASPACNLENRKRL